MDEIREEAVVLAEERKGRKKIADKSNWKREKAKVERHKPKSLPKKPSCRHGYKKRKFCCSLLSAQDISRFHRKFYAEPNKIMQDTFLLKYCVAKTPSRIGVPESCSNKKQLTISYFVPKYEITPRGRKNKLVKVCQKAFVLILGVSRARILRVCRQHSTTMSMPKENRGGDRRTTKYVDRKDNVKQYIMNLKSLESHYVRGRSKIQYLSSDLSIRKIWKIYNHDHADLRVTYEFFRRIFTQDFNVSFKTPATDCCSKCAEIRELIKTETDTRKKSLLMAQLRVHKLRAKWFYTNLANRQENEITFSFDCQKNLPVPKLPDQATYYSRQLYVYNLTMCQGTSHDSQTIGNTFSYTWLESEGLKGSNQIASAIHHRLSKTNFTENINHVRLMCDGCGGQNKNSIVLGMLGYWLKMEAPSHIKRITVFFPIVGHSFLPPDRIFGNIERQIRKKEMILTPDEYFETFSGFGTVLRLGQNFDFFDWKTAVQEVLKLPGSWHFKMNSSKRFFLRKDKSNRIAVKGEPYYASETINYGNICKRNKSFADIAPNKLNIGVEVNVAKIRDIKNLLQKHFGIEWHSRQCLQFYADLLGINNPGSNNPNEEYLPTASSSMSVPAYNETFFQEETDDENTVMEEVEELRI